MLGNVTKLGFSPPAHVTSFEGQIMSASSADVCSGCPYGAIALADFTAEVPGELSFTRCTVMLIVSTSPGNGWLMARLADERGLVPESYVRRHELQPAVMCHDFDAEETAELSTRRGERLSIVASIAAPAGWTFVVRTHGSGAVGPGLVPCDWLIRSPAVRMRAAFQREVVGGQCGYPAIIASPITGGWTEARDARPFVSNLASLRIGHKFIATESITGVPADTISRRDLPRFDVRIPLLGRASERVAPVYDVDEAADGAAQPADSGTAAAHAAAGSRSLSRVVPINPWDDPDVLQARLAGAPQRDATASTSEGHAEIACRLARAR
ncbi:hypothetical protein EMIHUDRAFT_202609 [Emiliania huxleyi CCMP1516]|uniref:SH3 domain-containing protein n=2 Tax=Emiliania huxleyi TaxID=2903 RepID=A0A0D3K8G8_EMIH1|nr:hypothetical protein EMIHUDRAFT_202609 [Emiliania huxleyi CCMP1516]EOD32053.1 hypothetical protein EMIHUDRAFT_202609 [Emiliania huxleyi CCMP1516]|eukprot:XP_005784482.1 hypothetical protein EMIHUDRAFT_202609 [Emiliania huxleyi CCMP1516]